VLFSCVIPPWESSIAEKTTKIKDVLSIEELSPEEIARTEYIELSFSPKLFDKAPIVDVLFNQVAIVDSTTKNRVKSLTSTKYEIKGDAYVGTQIFLHMALGGATYYLFTIDPESSDWKNAARVGGVVTGYYEYGLILQSLEYLWIAISRPTYEQVESVNENNSWTVRSEIPISGAIKTQDKDKATLDLQFLGSKSVGLRELLQAKPYKALVQSGSRSTWKKIRLKADRAVLLEVLGYYQKQGDIEGVALLSDFLSEYGDRQIVTECKIALNSLRAPYLRASENAKTAPSYTGAINVLVNFKREYPTLYIYLQDEVDREIQKREIKIQAANEEHAKLQEQFTQTQTELAKLKASLPAEPITNEDYETSVVVSGRTIGVLEQKQALGGTFLEEHEVDLFSYGRSVIITFSTPFSRPGQQFNMRVIAAEERKYKRNDGYITTAQVFIEVDMDKYEAYNVRKRAYSEHLDKINETEGKVYSLKSQITKLKKLIG
jgi:hypothetical protein